ncbi:porin [Polaribacter sp. NJDZ03]|uniref:porin n=1 Tax=Polaribacter sp. NJDZ03 TaxID=2855841 RepID=UPI0020C755F7|nr:porin [Polaribacter sp. NJDZ03]
MKTTKLIFTLIFLYTASYAQSNKLKLNLDETGKTYIKASVRMQLWARYFDSNPGTTINNEAANKVFDISIRRLRMGISAQLTPKLYVYSLFGGNNMNSKTEKYFQFEVLDLYAEYEFTKEFALGFGESGWEGLNRWNVRSSKSLMAVDAPLYSLLTVNKNDDIARGLGIWAKGQIHKFDYILSLKDPIQYGVTPTEGKVDFATNKPRKRISGYVKYEFLDNESNKSPYSGGAGTYIGTKNILNLGAGFMNQPKMTSQLINGIEKYYDFKNWAVDVFYDAPLDIEKGTAITTYLGYNHNDFGPNYVRNVGANDITSGGTSFNGSGNDFPMIGTGNTTFFQLGYLLAKGKKSFQLQPNIAVQYSDFDALEDAMVVYDLGINCFFNGHSNKLSLGYQNRPVYQNINNLLKVDERKGMLVLQYQIEIN